MTTPQPSLEALLEQDASFARLARTLVLDDSQADDLVQDLWLRALRRSPRRGGNLRAWLTTVMQNRAKDLNRAERRRRQHEAQAAAERPEGYDPDQIATRVELQRRVAGAVLALDEPYRGVILLRYFEGARPARIAQRLGRPVATIKTQLQRGLQQLRRSLDAEFGSRADWQHALLPLLSGLGPGLLAKPLVWAALVLICGGGIAWLATRERSEDPVLPRAEAVVAAAPDAELPGSEEAVVARHELSAPALRPPAEPGPSRPFCELVGRCVDEQGQPLPGVRVELSRSSNNAPEFREALRRESGMAWAAPDPQLTDARGRFRVRFGHLSAYVFRLEFSLAGRTPLGARWEAIEPGSQDLGDVELAVGCAIVGVIQDSDGRLLERRRISIVPAAPPIGRIPDGRYTADPYGSAYSDAAGAFVLDRLLPSGGYIVKVDGEQLQGARKLVIPKGARERTLSLRVRAGRLIPSIEGRVVDPEGRPLAHVTLTAWGYIAGQESRSGSYRCESDREGRFVFRKLPGRPETALQLHALYPGFEAMETEEPVAWGTKDLSLTLQPGLAVTLVLRHPDGTAVEDFGVYAIPLALGKVWVGDLHSLRHAGRHPGGRLVVERLHRGRYLLVAMPGGPRALPSRVRLLELEGKAGPTLVVELAPEALARLAVSNSAGEAVAGARIEVLDPFPGVEVRTGTYGLRLGSSGFSTQKDRAVVCGEVVSDSRGRADVRLRAGAGYAIRVHAPGYLAQTWTGLRLGQDEGPLRLQVSRGGSIRGQVVPAGLAAELRRRREKVGRAKELAACLSVEPIWRKGQPVVHAASWRRPITLDEEDRFCIEGLPAGDWRLLLHMSHGRAQVAEIRGLGLGEMRELELDLAARRPGRARLQAHLNGRPAADRVLTLRTPDRRSRRLVALDREGVAEVELLPGRYEVFLQVPTEGAGVLEVNGAGADLAIRSGERTQRVLHFAAGQLRMRLLDRAGQPVPGVRLYAQLTGRRHGFSLPMSDAKGEIRVLAPRGLLRLSARPRSAGRPGAVIQVGEVRVPSSADEAVEELELPAALLPRSG